jgi:hypothetical protein
LGSGAAPAPVPCRAGATWPAVFEAEVDWGGSGREMMKQVGREAGQKTRLAATLPITRKRSTFIYFFLFLI